MESLLRLREGKRLENGDTHLLHYALRCMCQLCGTLMHWDSPEGDAILISECCGLLYRLQPRSVVVEVTDISARPILPSMPGSYYSDPEADFSKIIQGKEQAIAEQRSGPLSDGQKSLRIGARKKPEEAIAQETPQRKGRGLTSAQQKLRRRVNGARPQELVVGQNPLDATLRPVGLPKVKLKVTFSEARKPK
jgi:hypothetical protein